jgi:preprotein translocase subunit SecG
MFITMKFLWYLASLLSVILILINNPKSEGLGSLGGQAQLFDNTRRTGNTLEIITWLSILFFLLLTAIFAAS